jgi:hypothetical protein
MRAMLGGAALAALATAAAAGTSLEALRWRSRVLVVSAPTAGDAGLKAQRAALGPVRGGLAERDLVVLEAVGDTPDALALRTELGLPAGQFRAVLVGKDGGAKLTAREPIPPQKLFSTIDAMPMRRDEMQTRDGPRGPAAATRNPGSRSPGE